MLIPIIFEQLKQAHSEFVDVFTNAFDNRSLTSGPAAFQIRAMNNWLSALYCMTSSTIAEGVTIETALDYDQEYNVP